MLWRAQMRRPGAQLIFKGDNKDHVKSRFRPRHSRLLARERGHKHPAQVFSGDNTDRAQLRRAVGRLEPGDVLMVTRLDRLAHSTRDLLDTLGAITDRQAGFRSLSDVWADTTTPHGRLMLTVLGGLAEFERELIRARTDDGRKRAKARGVKFGRPVKLTAHQRQEAIQRLAEGAVQADLARSYGVSQATISRLAAPSPFELSPAGA